MQCETTKHSIEDYLFAKDNSPGKLAAPAIMAMMRAAVMYYRYGISDQKAAAQLATLSVGEKVFMQHVLRKEGTNIPSLPVEVIDNINHYILPLSLQDYDRYRDFSQKRINQRLTSNSDERMHSFFRTHHSDQPVATKEMYALL